MGNRELTFVFWDVQHGNACYIHTPNDRHIVIDLGDGEYGDQDPFSPLLHLKNHFGVKQLDYVIITHPHRDHLDDIDNLLSLTPKTLRRPKHLTQEEIIGGNQPSDMAVLKKYFEVDSLFTDLILPGTPSDSDTSEQWGGVKMSFFCSTSCNRNNLNNHSIVSVFEYAGFKVMIPGDNEPESWKELIKNQNFVNASTGLHALLAPHHGRRSAYCPELFQTIGKPYITVISDGPECDTSATGSYGSQSKGWRVYYPDESYEDRLCVTTRNDGVIVVRIYYANDNSRRFNVEVQKGSGPNRD